MTGKITAITRQKGDKARASIFIEGGFAFGVNEQTIEQFRLRKGDHIDNDLYGKLIDFDYWIDAKRIALKYLNHRARSEKEIRERLEKEEIPEEIVLRVIDFLKGYGMVDDTKWAEAYTNDRMRRKIVSSRQLERELQQKGVDKEIIAETVGKLGGSEEERAFAAAGKRWPRIAKEPDSQKRKQKLSSFLALRGFHYSVIASVYKRLTSEPLEEADAPDPDEAFEEHYSEEE